MSDVFTPEIIERDLKANFLFLEKVLSDVSAEDYFKVPAEEKWSIQLILDHLRNSEKGVLYMSNGPTNPTNREPLINIQKIKNAFGDHTKSYPAPQVTQPINDGLDKESYLNKINKYRQAFLEEGNSKGWHEVLEVFPHPITGTMSRLEWNYFNIYHTERHIHQIRQIKNGLLGRPI